METTLKNFENKNLLQTHKNERLQYFKVYLFFIAGLKFETLAHSYIYLGGLKIFCIVTISLDNNFDYTNDVFNAELNYANKKIGIIFKDNN